MLAPYAKFYITLIGVAVTSSLALIPPTTPLWIVLTIVSGLVTAALTYQVPNAPAPGEMANYISVTVPADGFAIPGEPVSLEDLERATGPAVEMKDDA